MTAPSFLQLPDNAPLATSLRAVAKITACAERPWWIIGSAAVALHLDRNVGVQDIDVLLLLEDAGLVRQHLGISPALAGSHPLFRSDEYFTWTENPLPVEFMAGFSVFAQNKWVQIACETRQCFAVGPGNVYVPDTAELARLLKLFGRPKDADRLAALEKAGFSV